MLNPEISVNGHTPRIDLFWTGGWDSTFRLITLAGKEVIIQPWYLRDNRRSEWHELNAIEIITKELRERDSTRCIINGVKTIKTSEVEKDPGITDAWKNLRNKFHLGTQYDWLARFAKRRKGIELGIYKDGRIQTLINRHGALKKISSKITGTYYILDIAQSEEDLAKVFGNFHFPLLEITKMDMKWKSEELGYSDIMHKTWFCHSPLNNQPCGVCKTCCFAMEEGFGYRLSLIAHFRYSIKKLKQITHLPQLKARLYNFAGKTEPTQ
jgi:hypothetical protein